MADWNIYVPIFQSPHLEPLKEDTLAGTYKSVGPVIQHTSWLVYEILCIKEFSHKTRSDVEAKCWMLSVFAVFE